MTTTAAVVLTAGVVVVAGAGVVVVVSVAVTLSIGDEYLNLQQCRTQYSPAYRQSMTATV